jgi:hypothetical protein
VAFTPADERTRVRLERLYESLYGSGEDEVEAPRAARPDLAPST